MSFYVRFLSLIFSMQLLSGCKSYADVPLVRNGASAYVLVLPDAGAGKATREAAVLLQQLVQEASGVTLRIVPEQECKVPTAVYIGPCRSSAAAGIQAPDNGFTITARKGVLYITAAEEQLLTHAVAMFAERYMGCRKYDNGPAWVPRSKQLILPADTVWRSSSPFIYRESYYPAAMDAGYRAWHGLHSFETLWGLWGHSFNKLLPAATYFAAHPGYYAEVNGRRRADQLCLSEPKVLELVIKGLQARMADNPDALYWSVSPNDGAGYCTCSACRKTDAEEGGPQGSLIRFVNRVAAAFPAKKITTLAYGYSAAAPLKTRPAANVYILLSSIDAYREQALDQAASAAAFRKQLEQWSAITDRLFIWDYSTQFTNYLSPFPMLETLPQSYAYLAAKKVKGIFEQGSGDTYADMAELFCYVQARLLWQPDADVQAITRDFCSGYYGKAAPFVGQYLAMRRKNLEASGRHLDIYGNPITDISSFLAPAQLDAYDQLLEKADAATEGDSRNARVRRVRMGLDYVVLQQSRHFGADQYGFLTADGSARLKPKPGFHERVARFATFAAASGVRELSEGGLGPEAYRQEWQKWLSRDWPRNLAGDASLSLLHPFAEDYPAKGLRTLTDAMIGSTDFSYNWLCFYGTDMVATLHLPEARAIGTITMNFLEDQRHWIFLPVRIKVEVSEDGRQYQLFAPERQISWTEKERAQTQNFIFKGKARAAYIRVTAVTATALPDWRSHPAKKPMIACDEIYLLP